MPVNRRGRQTRTVRPPGIALMQLVFPVVRILQKLWGRPPGLRGSPWTRSSQRDQSHLNGKAGQGAVRGPGVRPTILQTVRSLAKRAAYCHSQVHSRVKDPERAE